MKVNFSAGKHILQLSLTLLKHLNNAFLLTFSELGATPGGMTQDWGAARADHDRVSVREDGGDPVAAGALEEEDTMTWW